MKIKEIIDQHRRDFRAVYMCEFCDKEFVSGGYDDDNFHQHVVPNFRCGDFLRWPGCGKSTLSEGAHLNPDQSDLCAAQQET
jgi:hypothetical protein